MKSFLTQQAAATLVLIAPASPPLSPAYAKPQSLCVNLGGTAGCLATISQAVSAITENHVIITVEHGSYTDNVLVNTGPKPKHLTVTINGPSRAESTIIEGGGAVTMFTIGPKIHCEAKRVDD